MRRRFEYTTFREREGVVYKRPCLDVVLNRADGRSEHSFPISSLIDTGSDLCMFDWAIANFMGFDPKAIGHRSEIGTFSDEKKVVYFVGGIGISVPAIRKTFSPRLVGFGDFKGIITGVLGHHGFLNDVLIEFINGECFEMVDDDPAPVLHLHSDDPVR